MCLIAYSPEAKPIVKKIFYRADRRNPDGIGIMHPSGCERFFGKRQEDEAWKYVRELFGKEPYAVHFRMGTHGETSLENVHPYEAPNGSLVMHNGICDYATLYKLNGTSDTGLFVKYFMEHIPEPGEKTYESQMRLFGAGIGKTSKLLILHPSKKFSLIHEDLGEERNGIWYSNTYSIEESRIWTKEDAAWRKAWFPEVGMCECCEISEAIDERGVCKECLVVLGEGIFEEEEKHMLLGMQ